MANTTHHTHPQPRRVRVPSKRARGLEPEVTAQPHSLASELGIVERDEAGLSIAPEDLGNHFLSEAVEQGDLSARDAAELELAMLGDPESEERPSVELSVWTRLIDLAADGGGASQQLTAAAAFGADALEDARRPGPAELERETEQDDASGPIRLTDSAIRERSLLDQEGAAFDETVSPEIEADDSGHHARLTPREALGEQVRGTRERKARGVRGRSRKLRTAARSRLNEAAGKVRAIARRVARKVSRD
jgi:hypothetical protein